MLQPLVHMVAASSTHGCSLSYTWLQVHYRDAANAAVAALLRGSAGGVYLAADDRPLTREQICLEACRAPRFAARTVPRFTGPAGGAADHGGGGIGKRSSTSQHPCYYSSLLLLLLLLLLTDFYYLLTSTYLLTTTYYHLPLPGKIVDSSSTRTAIGWQPKYKTFGAFIDTLV